MLGFPWQKDSPARRRATLSVEPLDRRDVPAVVAVNDAYSVQAGRVLTVAAQDGLLVNDFSTTNFGDTLSAIQLSAPTYVGNPRPLPSNALTVFPNGAFQFIAPSDIPAGVTQVQFSYQANNVTTPTDPPAVGVVTINISGNRDRFLAVGAGAGGGPVANVYRVGTGELVFSLTPYESSFTGGVRTATGDLTGDGVDDIAVAPGVGGGDRIVVFSGASGAVIFDSTVFGDPNFRGGAYVAIGDVDGNGRNDLVVGAGEGGGPRVTVLSGQTFASGGSAVFVLANFFAFEPSFQNGVRVAAGDVNGDGRAEIITAPGQGGGPVVRTFDLNQIVTNNGIPVPLLSFFAGPGTNRDGLFVAAGDLSGNGRSSIIVGTGNGAAVVSVFDGVTGGVLRQFAVPVEETPTGGGTLTGPGGFALQTPANGQLLLPGLAPNSLIQAGGFSGTLFANGQPGRGGVAVTAVDWNGDGLADVITGAGPGNVARVRVFDTTDNNEITNILAFPGTFLGGVFVGA